jgi:hypothetical protein
MRDAEPALNRDRARREGVVRRRRGEQDQIDRLRLETRGGEGGLCGLDPHVGGELAGSGDAALVNAGALDDPFIAGVDLAGKLVVGEDALWQVAAAAEHDRARHRHDAAPMLSPVPRT